LPEIRPSTGESPRCHSCPAYADPTGPHPAARYGGRDSLITVDRFTNDLDIVNIGKGSAYAAAIHRMIIGNQHADLHDVTVNGNSTRTVAPEAAADSTARATDARSAE
jgi:hypothetical protein